MASGMTQTSGTAATSVERCWVTPRVRLEGMKASRSQRRRVLREGAGGWHWSDAGFEVVVGLTVRGVGPVARDQWHAPQAAMRMAKRPKAMDQARRWLERVRKGSMKRG